MSTVRAVALVVFVCLVRPPEGRGDSMTVFANTGSWTYYYDPNNFVEKAFIPASTDSNSQGTFTSGSDSTGSVGTTAAALTTDAGAGSTGGALRPADAYINFGTSGNYPEASSLTVGNSQPWYTSPAVVNAFGHVPSAAEQSAFTSSVLADVKQTYELAGMSPNLTTDPAVSANHTISVVSGLSYAPNSNAIGITDVGHDGFGFLDKLNYASNPADLAWAVAHNVSHELMHAFGVSVHSDQSGNYVDAAAATWGLLTDPKATFSPAAAALITGTSFGSSVTSAALGGQGPGLQVDGDQEVLTVPEPLTITAWSSVVLGVLYGRRPSAARRSAA